MVLISQPVSAARGSVGATMCRSCLEPRRGCSPAPCAARSFTGLGRTPPPRRRALPTAQPLPATSCAGNPDAALEFARSLPKVELHAHINGCIRDATLSELCLACPDPAVYGFVVPPSDDRSLMQCFEMFGAICHFLIKDPVCHFFDHFVTFPSLFRSFRHFSPSFSLRRHHP